MIIEVGLDDLPGSTHRFNRFQDNTSFLLNGFQGDRNGIRDQTEMESKKENRTSHRNGSSDLCEFCCSVVLSGALRYGGVLLSVFWFSSSTVSHVACCFRQVLSWTSRRCCDRLHAVQKQWKVCLQPWRWDCTWELMEVIFLPLEGDSML